MEFMQALSLAMSVIKEQQDKLDRIYLYERNSKMQIALTNFDASVEFSYDEPLPEQIYLASFLDENFKSKFITLEVIFSASWEVRLRKNQHLKATMERLGKTSETFIDYTPVDREEVADV